MKVFYESKLAKWLLWQGYSTITLGCFVFTKKSKEEMKQSTLNMRRFMCANGKNV